MKSHVCHWPNCGKTFTRAEHLRRHALNHDQARQGYTCERCSVHFHRPDLLSRCCATARYLDSVSDPPDRHLMRHAKRDEEAGGPGQGVLETRKRTRRAGDGSIITRPPKRQSRARASHSLPPSSSASSSSISVTSAQDYGAPVSPPTSASDPSSMSLDEPDPLLAPMMPSGPFEPYVEPIPGQFDAADGSWSLGLDGMGDFFSLDTGTFPLIMLINTPADQIATDFNMPFAATHNYNWLFDVASLDDAFPPFDLPLGPDMVTFAEDALPIEDPKSYLERDGSSVLLQAASFVERSDPLVFSAPILDPQPDTINLDWMDAPSLLQTTPQPHLPILTEEARQGILNLIAQAPPLTIDGQPTPLDSPLLSLPSLQSYSDLFFTRFNTTYPLLHQPTFSPSTTTPVLLAAILSMGATYSSREAHQLAVGIHDSLRNQLFCHADFSPQPDLWVLQAMLLIDCFGKMRAGPKQRERAQLFHCVLIKLIRRSDCCAIRHTPNPATATTDTDIDTLWHTAMHDEQKKRVALHCFMWDTQHAVLFSQSLCMSAFEIRSALPCSQSTWEACTASDWAHHASMEPPPRMFLSVLKGYINPSAMARPRDLNTLARIVVLHGLMSVSADLKRRDQTTLRAETPERVGAWTRRMGRSYDLWKVDFDADCLAMKLNFGQHRREDVGGSRRGGAGGVFTGLKMAACALYRAAWLALQVEILDLQVAAGAGRILGRTVTEGDRERSRRGLRKWLLGGGEGALGAARQAAKLLEEAVLSLHDWEQTDAFHFPWCLYLATLTCWAFHGGVNGEGDGGGSGSGERVTTDLASLIVAMTTCGSLGDMAALGGKYDTRGLVRTMAQQLATVRWAVVHDAMKVLVNLGN
ncbi:C2H2 finger domain transcription factor [Aspergillus luchuensis]|uniref:C2H2 finger domain transcription factor n=1 Tax=Aspergillus kawachii TaxID=1069201 RepID=A0A146FAF3_ASPKA|nr:C2H2 finger domain transcription factor [Aspergillus luchuensis]